MIRLRERWLIEECVVVGDRWSYVAALVAWASAEYRCSGVGLMFFSIQAMNMAGLCHSGESG